MSWGIRPVAMVGHSVGEYVAACVAGVFSLEDALRLIGARCRLMQDLPRGSMLAVRKDEATVAQLIAGQPDLDLAAVNSPQLCVVSGPDAAIDSFIQKLDAEKVVSRRLATSHAFHSRMVEPALAPFAEVVRTIAFAEPSIPYVSTLTGKWITLDEVSKPEYWTSQLRHTVRFADAVREILKTPERIMLEVGPAETLVPLIRQTAGPGPGAPAALSSLGSARDNTPDDKAVLSALGSLWTLGANPDWNAFHAGYRRRRVLLPTYPFERHRHWVDAPASKPAQPQLAAAATPPLPSFDQIQASVPPAEVLIMATPASAAPNDTMLTELKALITDLSGTELSDAEPDASFLELGFDSLFLTQLTQGIQSKFRVKLTFRQIMESYPTLGSLAAHLDSTVAPELRAAPVAAPAPVQAVQAAPVQAAPTQIAAAAPIPLSAPMAFAPALASAGSYEALFAGQAAGAHQPVPAADGVFAGPCAGRGGFCSCASYKSSGRRTISNCCRYKRIPPAATVAQPAPVPAATSSPTVESKPAKPAFTPFKPLQRGETGGLNPAQESYLKDLIQSYTARTSGSKRFTQDHRGVFADGRVVSGFNAQTKELVYPLVVNKASGAYLWDNDGNRYIDILNGYGAILYGHSPDFIVEAVRNQLDLGFAIGPQTELSGICAELVSELTGCSASPSATPVLRR